MVQIVDADDYILNSSQAGTLVGRDAQTIRYWYGQSSFREKYPAFKKNVYDTNRGQENVLISVSELARVARDRRWPVRQEAIRSLISNEFSTDPNAERMFLDAFSEVFQPSPSNKDAQSLGGSQGHSLEAAEYRILLREEKERNLRLEGRIEMLEEKQSNFAREYLDDFKRLNEDKARVEIAKETIVERFRSLVVQFNQEIAMYGSEIPMLPMPDADGAIDVSKRIMTKSKRRIPYWVTGSLIALLSILFGSGATFLVFYFFVR